MNDPLPFPTLPLAWYVEPEILAIERTTIFGRGPEYVGCTAMVPEHGCHQTVAQRDHAEVLVRDGDSVHLLSNICLHRNLLMMHGRGRRKAIVCPMHRWSYDLAGRVLKAPHYPETPCLRLPSRRLQDWNGILFAGERDVRADLAPLTGRPELDVHGYVLVQQQEEEQPINWKIPVEVLLENYHVPVIHPGLTRFVHKDTWHGNDGAFDSDWLRYQEMRPHPDFSRNPASPVFEQWQQAILEVCGGKLPGFAALIALYSPNIFLEWYPYTFVVTTYVPRTPERTLMNRHFYYAPQALAAVPEFAELAKAAWDENQGQDDEVHEALHRGRALHHRQDPDGLSGHGTYQIPTEESVLLFHRHLMAAVVPHLEGRLAPARDIGEVVPLTMQAGLPRR